MVIISRLKNQQGVTMVLVLALMVILIILGFAAIGVADNQTIMVSRHQQREQALHYAEAGVHRYMAELNKDLAFFNTSASTAMQNTDTAFEDGFYRLEVVSPSNETPYVIVRSTGWHKNSDIKRTVEVKMSRRDFLLNLITANVGSDRYAYCNRFIRGDVINGPLHMNGDLIVNGHTGDGYTGPIFNGAVTYSGNFTREDFPAFTSDTTIFNKGEPQKVDRLGIPASNENMKAKADYVFSGRTCIYINNSSLEIRDKDGSSTSLSIPEDGLIIYVKGGSGNNKWSKNTANVYISGVLDGRLTIAAENDIYITSNNPTIWSEPGSPASTGGITYSGLNGTITAENIDSKMASCDDMLGLIANRNVRILHYNWPKADGSWYGTFLDVAPTDMTVHASICAVTGSFEYEEHAMGSAKGTLTVVGSITQYMIGPIAGYAANLLDIPEDYDFLHSRISGYGKIYWYDPRLLYQMPPEFLEPENSGWEIIEWREVSNPVITP